jgi:pyruvate,water dikinase
MKWFRHIFQARGKDADAELQTVQTQFIHFLALLEKNNQVLKVLADMEEKSQGEYLFDRNYIRACLQEIRSGMEEIIGSMISLGGEQYAPLRDRYAAIDAEVEEVLRGNRPLEKDDYTIPLDRLDRERAYSVGSKSAQLGELKKLGLPVPEGFAISAWAYKHFVDANDLQARITDAISDFGFRISDFPDPGFQSAIGHRPSAIGRGISYEDLVRVGEDIRAMVLASPVPEDLAEAIQQSYAEMVERQRGNWAAKQGKPGCEAGETGPNFLISQFPNFLISRHGFALRSSAIGEDTLFSFAGQYTTFLNVGGDELVERYREVLASKFTPQAIYYFLSHDLSESELAMGVCCLAMVDAAASGVIYTRDPVQPEDGCVLVSSIYGLGKYLVDGTLTPDLFRVSREDGRGVEAHLAVKPVRLVLRPDGGMMEEPVPEAEQEAASLREEHLRLLAEFAVKIEDHYSSSQDIEWALDRSGQLFLLQTRPLRVVRAPTHPHTTDRTDRTDQTDQTLRVVRAPTPPLRSGGVTVCPGAGSGPVFHAASTRDLSGVPEGAVLVAPHSFPGLVTVMGRVNALVTEVGSVVSHAATLAREHRLPTLVGVERARELPAGREVTVDATGAAIYAGAHPELVEVRRPEYELFEDTAIFHLLKRILAKVSPLNLLHPGDPNFTVENCRTLHDLTRFAHQKAMEEMFSQARGMEHKDRLSRRLRSNIPLGVDIIYIDQAFPQEEEKRWIEEDEIASVPMQAFWEGIKEEGWPSQPPLPDLGGFMSVLATHAANGARPEFSENSFAVLSREYMILSLRMGYHFTTLEAMCTAEPSNNYIRMQHKGGGASLERRVRRIRLLTELLARIGLEPSSQGDFLNAAISYLDPQTLLEKLRLLGRTTMITKQLDMALSNDALAQWYTEDFLKRLGLWEGGKDEG